MNLSELVDDFLDYLFQIRGYSEETVKTYEIPLRQMVEHSRLTKEKDRWVLEILPFRRVIAANSKRTVAKKLSAVRSFVRYLNEQRGIDLELEGAESVKVPKTLPKPLEEEYIFEVLEAADPMERLLLLLLYGLGLRIGEIAGLERDRVGKDWILIHGKGGKSRQLPVPSPVVRAMEEYLALYPQGRYLFEKGGVPMNASQLRYRVGKLFKARGIKATPHQLRHSFATHLLEHGARISDVSELLGHSSMATTQIYTKLGSVKKREEYLKAHPLAK